ncbi:collagen alpha-1(XV) chain-like [Chrysoperla carnea]|uniref:collagen alpha-1(XV) chain-like n=1 Tax=Chrysoperla carnea TaxID=189513 RepID=UPI001D06C914|nr:collagen alpha-1(XV) chain-like [Chrysoperla carnea]
MFFYIEIAVEKTPLLVKDLPDFRVPSRLIGIAIVILFTKIFIHGANSVGSTGGKPSSSRNDPYGAEHDLLQAIKIPFNDPKTQYFENGLDGFPAFGLRPGSDIKSPYRLFIPEKLYPEFSIVVTVRSLSREGGFLFAVVNPLDTIVQLGVQLSPVGFGSTNISLYYTDPSYFTSQAIASFVVPVFHKKWTRFSLRVTNDDVTLFFNCEEYDKVEVQRVPQELVFDSASTLYIGQAGPIIKGAFEELLRS